MIRRLWTADRELKIAEAEARREQEAARVRKLAYRAQARDDLDSTTEILTSIKPDNVGQSR